MPLPDLTPRRLAVKIKSAAERHVRRGHPWIYDESIVQLKQDGRAGDLAIIFDQKKNQLLAVGLYDPASPIRIKVLQVGKALRPDTAYWEQLVRKAHARRLPLLQTDTNSYRLIYGENDGLPGLIADVYDRVLVLKVYSAIWWPWLRELLPVLLKAANAECCVLRLSRLLQQSEDTYGLTDGQVIAGELPDPVVIFREHGLQFAANVVQGHKTGYFLDHRHNRRRVGELASDRSVLDVFSYAGGFTVHALAGGAREVTSLDISAQALSMAEENVALNGLQARHRTMAADAFIGLQQLAGEGHRYDLVIVDPPSFAKSKAEIPGALQSYQRLCRLALPLVSRGGILVMASCSSRVTAEAFFAIVLGTLEESGRPYTEMERSFHDIDHPIRIDEGAYLKCIYLQL